MNVDPMATPNGRHANKREEFSQVFQGSVRSVEPEPEESGRQARAVRIFKIGIGAAAGASFVASVSLWFLASREQGLFVGLWVPSILSLGTLMLSGGRAHDTRP